MRLLIPLFSPATGTWGGLTRVLAIAQASESAGHQTAFIASGPLADNLRKRGFPVYPAPAPTLFGLPKPIARLLERRSQRISLPVKSGKSVGSLGLVYLASGLARAGYLREEVKAEQRAVRDFHPDVLFTDLDPAAYILARTTGLPIATAFQGAMMEGLDSLPWKMMQGAESRILREHNLAPMPPEELHFGPDVLKIIPSIPELDGTDPGREDVRYVGHLLGEIDKLSQSGFVPAEGHRYVFVYMGTGSVSLDRLEKVLPEVFPAGGKTICLVGAQSIEQFYRLGAVEFRPYIPASSVLPFCDWTLCHGGQNTIIQSLREGVPLLIFPGPIFERRINAKKVQMTGSGLMGEIDQFTPGWLRNALSQQAGCTLRAAALSGRICSYGGPDAAVAAIHSLVAQ